ncbi:MAG TPA: hypothetical protein VG963_00390, partial [Polyangiaceae bacterium]|nr:hypothetical protein [Polyangiaceae bacterium]
HDPPGTSEAEVSTAALIDAQLRVAGYEVERGSDPSELVAVFRNGPGNTLLYRTDAGAAAVTGQHRIHDLQITWLLGMARALAQLRTEWRGTLVLESQPARLLGRAVKLGQDAARRLGPLPNPVWMLAFRAAAVPFGSLFSAQGKRQPGAHDVDIHFGSIGAFSTSARAPEAPGLAAALSTSFGTPQSVQFAYFLIGVSPSPREPQEPDPGDQLAGDRDSTGGELDLRAIPLGSTLATLGVLQLLGKQAHSPSASPSWGGSNDGPHDD